METVFRYVYIGWCLLSGLAFGGFILYRTWLGWTRRENAAETIRVVNTIGMTWLGLSIILAAFLLAYLVLVLH